MSVYPLKHQCQWCKRNTNEIKQSNSCDHRICDRCLIRKTKCRSKCPQCWENNIKEFLKEKRICSVCLTELKNKDSSSKCYRKHSICSNCYSQGCVLCQFCELHACFSTKSDDLSADKQRIFNECQTWQDLYEKQTHFKQSDGDENNSENEADRSETKSNRLEIKEDPSNGDCVICYEKLGSHYRTLEHCKHHFHHLCIEQWFQSNGKQSCPTCGYVYSIGKGPQPPNGKLFINYLSRPLPGFEHEQSGSNRGETIEITYVIPSGIQGPLNPQPGQPYTGTTRRAYLPNTTDGREILRLLQRAFQDQHVFTIGRSTTTGQDNVVTWNDIHHKTSITGGPQRFGYPDPTYLLRVRQELADKGYK